MSTQRWKLTIEYKGTHYSGWQIQPNVPSVQETIQIALKKFCQKDIKLTVAGRTDAGVHAMGQVAHFDLNYTHSDGSSRALEGFELTKAINAHMLDEDVSIIKAERVAPDFHARFDALNKMYHYRLIRRAAPLAIERGLAWQHRLALDVEAMRDGAKYLLGQHDFTTFRDSECQAKSPIRTLDRLDIKIRNYDGPRVESAYKAERDDGTYGTEILFSVEGKSFLHHQVRNMVGTLVEVGKGKWEPADIKTALKAKDRRKGGPTAPADGLYFMHVEYP